MGVSEGPTAVGGPGPLTPPEAPAVPCPLCGEKPAGPHTGAGALGGEGQATGNTRSLPARLALPTGLPGPGRWVRRGRRHRRGSQAGRPGASPVLGTGGPRQRPTGHFLPVSISCLPAALRGVVLVLEPDTEHGMDVILVASSELSAPASPAPRRGECSLEYGGHRRGGWPRASAMSKVPGFWTIHMPGQGRRAPHCPQHPRHQVTL